MNNYLPLDENPNPVPACYTILMLVVVHSSSPDGAAHSVRDVGTGGNAPLQIFVKRKANPVPFNGL